MGATGVEIYFENFVLRVELTIGSLENTPPTQNSSFFQSEWGGGLHKKTMVDVLELLIMNKDVLRNDSRGGGMG